MRLGADEDLGRRDWIWPCGTRAHVPRRGGEAAYRLGVESVTSEYWNHNVHYQRVILDALPDRCGAAVDVGCGTSARLWSR